MFISKPIKCKYPAWLVNRPSKKAVCIYVEGEVNKAGREAWANLWAFVRRKRLLNWRTQSLGLFKSTEFFYNKEISFEIGVTTKQKIQPEGKFYYKEVQGGKYIRFTVRGAYSEFPIFYQFIFNQWLATSGYYLREGVVIERYLNNPQRVAPDKLKTYVYLPVL